MTLVRANGSSAASLETSLQPCQAGESAAPKAGCWQQARMFSVTLPVCWESCVISTSPKCKLQICQNGKRVHWICCVFVCTLTNGPG